LTCLTASKNEISTSAVAENKPVESKFDEMSQKDIDINYCISTSMVWR